MQRNELWQYLEREKVFCKAMIFSKNHNFYVTYGIQKGNNHVLLQPIFIEGDRLDHMWINNYILSCFPCQEWVYFNAKVIYYRKGNAYYKFSYQLEFLNLIGKLKYLEWEKHTIPKMKFLPHHKEVRLKI